MLVSKGFKIGRLFSLICFMFVASATSSMAGTCYINVPTQCQHSIPINQWFQDTYNNASTNQVACMQRAADYQSWCGASMAYASYWSDAGVNSWLAVENGYPRNFYLPGGTSIPLNNFYQYPTGRLTMQTDGNLVAYNNGVPIWTTNAMLDNSIPVGSSTIIPNCVGCNAQFEWNGNLTLYRGDGSYYWSSHTWTSGGGRLLLYPSSPTVQITNLGWGVIFTSMQGIDWLNNQVRPVGNYLDYLIQNVCVDAFDHQIAGDPASCSSHRNIRVGEKVPYLITDVDKNFSNRRYQAIFSNPVHGADGTLKVMVAKNMAGNFNANFTFSFNQLRDGFDLIDTTGNHVSGIRTSDGGCLDQVIYTNWSQRNNGWIFFAKDLGSGILNHNILINRLTPPAGCEAVSQDTSNSTQDIWNPPAPFAFESGKVLNTIQTYHVANSNLSQTNNAIEKFFFTKEYGFSRWEAWIPYARCLSEHGDVPYCHPDTNPGMTGRCSGASAIATWGGQTWVRTDCRDTTFYLALNKPVVPLNTQMAQNNGLVDIISWISLHAWW